MFFFFDRFCAVEVWGFLTLLKSWFVNLKFKIDQNFQISFIWILIFWWYYQLILNETYRHKGGDRLKITSSVEKRDAKDNTWKHLNLSVILGKIFRIQHWYYKFWTLVINLFFSPSHTLLIILIRFITLKNNWMNPCAKMEGKCNESVNNKIKIIRQSNSLWMDKYDLGCSLFFCFKFDT